MAISSKNFDEKSYLKNNPDVAVAVKAGELASGAEHYLRFGKNEGRLFDTKSPSENSILDEYITTIPSDQNVIDVFAGEWSSAMPTSSGLVSTPGSAALFEDSRINWAEKTLGGFAKKDILELGPLEGGHSYMLQKAGASSIIAIESNRRAFQKCLCVKEIFGLDRVHFKLGDFNEYLNMPATRRFDLVVASGVLYHMIDPVLTLTNMSKFSDKLFLWTHYLDWSVLEKNAQMKDHFEAPHAVDVNGFQGDGVRRFYNNSLAWNGFCGGMEPYAIWLTKETIIEVLKQQGFSKFDMSFDNPEHQNGPAFALCASR